MNEMKPWRKRLIVTRIEKRLFNGHTFRRIGALEGERGGRRGGSSDRWSLVSLLQSVRERFSLLVLYLVCYISLSLFFVLPARLPSHSLHALSLSTLSLYLFFSPRALHTSAFTPRTCIFLSTRFDRNDASRTRATRWHARMHVSLLTFAPSLPPPRDDRLPLIREPQAYLKKLSKSLHATANSDEYPLSFCSCRVSRSIVLCTLGLPGETKRDAVSPM